ncbi:MAG: hypothetical protein RBT50_04685 [Bacteroidales bacterium]|jgi:hypothetical protein|nr:hypothetical protein [Bacteroidales bacterium]
MEPISSRADLRNSIQLLEIEHTANGNQLKAQFYAAYETFKPVNLLRSTLNDITSSPNMIENILGTSLGLAAGLASNLLFKGLAGPGIRKVLSPLLQSGVTSFVAKNTGSLRSKGELALLRIFRNKKVTSRNRDY